LTKPRLGRVEARLEWFALHLEHHLPFLNDRAFLIYPLFQNALDACSNIDLSRALRLSEPFECDRHITRLNLNRSHLDRLDRRNAGLLLFAAHNEKRANQDST
jgi:hypothetical protein